MSITHLHLPTKSGTKSVTTATTNVVRVLYVHSGIDEKTSSAMLEEVTRKLILSHHLVFTCVTSAFMAVECVQSTSFDLVIVQRNMPLLNGLQLMNILYKYNHLLPVIFLTARNDTETVSFKFPPSVAVESLSDPYTPLELCSCMYHILHSCKIYLRFVRHGPAPNLSAGPSGAPSYLSQLPTQQNVAGYQQRQHSSSSNSSASSASSAPSPFPNPVHESFHEEIPPTKRSRQDSAPPQAAVDCFDDFGCARGCLLNPPFLSPFSRKGGQPVSLLSVEEEDILWEELRSI